MALNYPGGLVQLSQPAKFKSSDFPQAVKMFDTQRWVGGGDGGGGGGLIAIIVYTTLSRV